MDAASDTPSAMDLAHPLERYTSQGVTVVVLREHWRRHPATHPAPWAGVNLAYWKDGTFAPVPSDASPELLAHYYFAARVLREAAE